MSYQIQYRPEIHEDLDGVPKNIERRLKRAIEERLMREPSRYGERLARDLYGLWKIRVGDYRIVYEIKEDGVVIWAIRPRRDVYPVTGRRRRRADS